MRRSASILAASITTVATLAGCPNREVSKVDITQQKQEKKEIPVVAERDVDILFVIDDSDSMGEEQQSLADNFPRFIGKLEGIQGGLPNVHIGIVSTTLFAHPDIPACKQADSDEGALKFAFDSENPLCSDGSVSLDGQFIKDVVVNEETGERQQNYQGELADVFSCMAKLGVGGCGFEMPLESMRKALQSDANEGFLRQDAFLAVIIIADEDDCSTFDQGMFDPNISGKDSALGPLDSFRCFEFGVQCNPDEPRVLGEKFECAPRPDSPYMYSVDEYVNFLKGLKPNDPGKLIVAGIIGVDEENPDEPVKVIEETKLSGEVFSLDRACEFTVTDENGDPVLDEDGNPVISKAAPGVRLRSFLEQFPERNTITTICNEDLSGALDLIGSLLAKVLDNPFCLTTDVFRNGGEGADGTLPYDCQVSDVLYGEETPLPHCDSTTDPTNKPCWFIQENMQGCMLAGEPYQELVVERDVAPPSDTDVIIHCAVE